MNTRSWFGSLVLAGLLAAPVCRADEPAGLTFKTAASRDAKDFQVRVFEKVLKTVRTRPVQISLAKGEYSDLDKGRKQLKLTGSYKGAVTRAKFDVTITIKLDTTADPAWEVLKIGYEDNNRLMPRVNESKLAALAKDLGK